MRYRSEFNSLLFPDGHSILALLFDEDNRSLWYGNFVWFPDALILYSRNVGSNADRLIADIFRAAQEENTTDLPAPLPPFYDDIQLVLGHSVPAGRTRYDDVKHFVVLLTKVHISQHFSAFSAIRWFTWSCTLITCYRQSDCTGTFGGRNT